MKYVWIFMAAFIAFGKGRSVVFWTVATYYFSWLALLYVSLVKNKRTEPIQLHPAIKEWMESHYAKKEYKDFNTVDDLFKQLESK